MIYALTGFTGVFLLFIRAFRQLDFTYPDQMRWYQSNLL